MDLIKLYSSTVNPTDLNRGQAINGYTSALWVERYRDPGEFKIEAPLSSGLITFLPIGAFVTHLETSTVMMVENHEIKQPKDDDPTISITGRCFTCFLENRTVGDPQAFTTNTIDDWLLTSDQTWDQVVTLIDTHIISAADTDANLIGVDVNHVCSGTVTTEERILKPTDVHQAVIDILKIDDLGIKSVRPTSTDPLTYFTVYRGDDVSTKVRFSWMRGDLDNVEYFFSDKKMKNQARVMGRWVQVVVNPSGADRYDRRVMLVDGSFIDERQTAYPTGLALDYIRAGMNIIGAAALKKQNNLSITQADVSENSNLRYRRDYELGDLVTVDGDFGTSTVMRVVEYAEAEDENGVTGHPTLAIPGED